jgi:hypothetical protein
MLYLIIEYLVLGYIWCRHKIGKKEENMSKTKRVVAITFLILMIAIALLSMVIPFGKVTKLPDVLQASVNVQDEKKVLAKQELARQHLSEFKEQSIEQKEKQSETFWEILDNRELSQNDREVLLNAIGYYTFENEQPLFESYSNSGNVYLSDVSVYYNVISMTWTLTGAGFWYHSSYWDDANIVWPSVGKIYDVGKSSDAVGILLHDTYGNSNGVSLVDGFGRFSNGTDKRTEYNRFTGVTSSNGAVYKVRDTDYVHEVNTFLGVPTSWKFYYNANDFNVSVTFNSNFTNYHGNAVFMYAHTWNDAELNSITIGKDSIGIGWSNGGNRWDIMSHVDMPF